MKGEKSYFALAKEDWEAISFGDQRLNERAIKIANSFLQNPFVSPPRMMKSTKDTKAFYRFIDSDKVTHDQLILPHIATSKTTLHNRNCTLCIHDSTTITLNRNYEIEGTYKIGGNNGNSKGIIVHNSISVVPHENYALIDGLLHQSILLKERTNEKKTSKDYTKLWLDGINAIGTPKNETTFVDIMDRGADILEVMHCSLANNHKFIIRAKHNRWLDKKNRLFGQARYFVPVGETLLEVQSNSTRKKRIAKLKISFGKVTLPNSMPSKNTEPIYCNVVRVYEVDCHDDQDKIEWVLLTSLEVNNFKNALQVVNFYSCRWIIEEYHKCMKTGFRLEETQLRTARRIENLIGFVSVSSVKLLQIRDITKHDPSSDAIEYVTKEDVNIVKAYYKIQNKSITIDSFLRCIAQMGGFQNRKGDGNPGWQSIWEGWKFFLGMKEGAKLQKEARIYG